jgi:hypothetical protein
VTVELLAMLKNALLILSILIITPLVACDNKKDVTETNSYNSFFVFPKPDERIVYVGTVKGLSSCKYAVSDYYSKRRKFVKGQWDYICCLKTADNECAEKHRYKDEN